MEESQNEEHSVDIRPVILVVDDEEHVRMALGRALGSAYQVLLAEDGREALDLLATRNAERFSHTTNCQPLVSAIRRDQSKSPTCEARRPPQHRRRPRGRRRSAAGSWG